MTESDALRERWKAHLARAFPRGAEVRDVGNVDSFNLIDLDSFISGYVSRAAGGERLGSSDLEQLSEASLYVRRAAHELSGEARDYFIALAELAESVPGSRGSQS